MNISEIFRQKRLVYSFEIFPPKRDFPISTIYHTLDSLADLAPDFISITYGAGGSSRQRTCELAALVQEKYHRPALAHLTGLYSTRAQVDQILGQLRKDGVTNILAMRGDYSNQQPPCGDFAHASDLIAYIRQAGGFDICAACYPEGHPESASAAQDIRYLRQKQEAGASHLISQLFFDNEDFYRFLERCEIAGITLPVEAGIMPVTSKGQIERMVTLCGAKLPSKFSRMLARYEHSPQALTDAGIAYATDQIIDLAANGVRGIHLYTMNKPQVARRITQNIQSILEAGCAAQ